MQKNRSQRYFVMIGRECANCGRRGDFVQESTNEAGEEVWLCTASDCGHEAHKIPTDSIDIIFDTPTNMKVFTWKGEVDTTMSPMDSIRYYKAFLQSGLNVNGSTYG